MTDNDSVPKTRREGRCSVKPKRTGIYWNAAMVPVYIALSIVEFAAGKVFAGTAWALGAGLFVASTLLAASSYRIRLQTWQWQSKARRWS